MSTFNSIPAPDPDLPCCMASANTDGRDCTCWRPVLDPPAPDAIAAGPMLARKKACHDCAYRAGSRERKSDGGALPDYGPTQPLLCHQGASKIIRWEHPSGATIDVTEDDYTLHEHRGRPSLASGAPAELCAGWAAVNCVRKSLL